MNEHDHDEAARQEQEDLELAIAMSLGQDPPAPTSKPPDPAPQSPPPPPQPNNAAGFLVTRKVLEQERLARLEKRKAGNEPGDGLSESLSSKRQRTYLEQPDTRPIAQTHQTITVPADSEKPGSKQSSATPRYLQGALRLTHVENFRGNYVKFADLIDKDHLEKATLSAYVVDPDWLFTQLPADKNVCLIMHGLPTGAQRKGQHLVVVRPPMGNGNIGCFHAKLMLLYFGTFVRVVVGSANLMRYDWSELENILFIQDFPRLPSGPLPSASSLPRFAREIHDMLVRMGTPRAVNDALLDFNFAGAKAHIIASVSGMHEGTGPRGYRTYGFARLGEVVRDIGAAVEGNSGPVMECQRVYSLVRNAISRPLPSLALCAHSRRSRSLKPTLHHFTQTSSLGGLTAPWLANFYRAARGVDPATMTTTVSKSSRGSKGGGSRSRSALAAEPLPTLTVVYPSRTTVEDSLGGKGVRIGLVCWVERNGGAGTIFFNKASYYKDTFPRAILRDCISRRSGVLMHSKIILTQLPVPRILDREDDDSDATEVEGDAGSGSGLDRKIGGENDELSAVREEAGAKKGKEGVDEEGEKRKADVDEGEKRKTGVDEEGENRTGEGEEREGGVGEKGGKRQAGVDEEGEKRKVKKLVGWVYCGSHNFTEAAWGKFTTSRDTKQPKITMSNWELGVVLPLIEEVDGIGGGGGANLQDEDWFVAHGVPVPFMRPPPEYPEDEVPWLQEGFY
ncbi:hypothetical protein BC938DRAFT_474297 [Jimgerdemannia flammicorona]|uniref:Tyrosyl-DNA phosphodiesterase-domain-containing protein n=1 Tax=Jimgerdemannia flammicorona TaxID=994334 RepID=A0A433Q2F3_9FUNG|nr:hypothetical protein BC938DRAFT_474297 [Jimgerdemannia flammicorona]